MKLHYFVLVCLIKAWPDLFMRYYNEYDEAYANYLLDEQFENKWYPEE